MEKEVGKITHWYDKLGVAVIKLSGALKVGDKIKVKKGDEEFEDAVNSMQLDHKDIATAERDDEVAVKLSQKAKEGATVFKTE